jgi:synaptojanin
MNLNSLGLHADIFLAVVTSATEVGNTRPSASSTPESVAKIHEVSFYCLTSPIWDDLASAIDMLPSPDAVDLMMRGGDPSGSMNYQYNHPVPPGTQPQVFEHPCLPLTKILSSGSFYYALESHWDLSSRLSTRFSNRPDMGFAGKKDMGDFDERFVWNEYIVRSLLDFRERLDIDERKDLDRCQFIVRGSISLC